MSRRHEVRAELMRLPWDQRDAITEAIGSGRAVEDERLAALAAEWAAECHHRVQRVTVGVLATLTVIAVGLLVWLVGSNDRQGGVVAALLGCISASGVTGLIIWTVVGRSLARAERANRALTGSAEPRRRRQASPWFIALLAVWSIAIVIGIAWGAISISLLGGSLAFVGWIALVRVLDSRQPRRGSAS